MSTLQSPEYFREFSVKGKVAFCLILLLIGIIAGSDVPAATNTQKSSVYQHLDDVEILPAVDAEFEYLGQGDPNRAIPAERDQMVYLASSREMLLSMWLNRPRAQMDGEYSFVLRILELAQEGKAWRAKSVVKEISSPIKAPDDLSEYVFSMLDLPSSVYAVEMAIESMGERDVVFRFGVTIGAEQNIEIGGKQ